MSIIDSIGDAVYVVTTPGEYKYIGQLNLVFNEDGKVVAVTPNSKLTYVTSDVLPDSNVLQSIEDPIQDDLNELVTNVIGTSEADLNGLRNSIRNDETNLRNLVADALLYSANNLASTFGVDTATIAIQNGGGIRNNSIIPKGDINELHTFDILPFSNFVSIVEAVSSARLKEVLENMVSGTRGGLNPGSGRFGQVSGIVQLLLWSMTTMEM